MILHVNPDLDDYSPVDGTRWCVENHIDPYRSTRIFIDTETRKMYVQYIASPADQTEGVPDSVKPEDVGLTIGYSDALQLPLLVAEVVQPLVSMPPASICREVQA
ncbi:hypothetical protein DT076_16590 [Desertihabitans brevis]|uniref:Uncharacterized protein n=1 Tax=Desertihabitans brevis TaxID=2268447 RepID=A0A367YQU7_9ACTN|nr:hypothetical protein [Desertihabitans brevis]RCK68266.1 hypothetical protein DT076_16590 [Desertihabitans brevis]